MIVPPRVRDLVRAKRRLSAGRNREIVSIRLTSPARELCPFAFRARRERPAVFETNRTDFNWRRRNNIDPIASSKRIYERNKSHDRCYPADDQLC